MIPFPDLNYNEREKSYVDGYHFDIGSKNYTLDNLNISMEIKGKDGWLPSSILVVARTKDQRNHTLSSYMHWNKWFDVDGVATPEHKLY